MKIQPLSPLLSPLLAPLLSPLLPPLQDGASLADFGSKVMCENETPIVEKVEGGVVTFAASAENSKRVGSAFKEGVSYDQVASMMSKTALRQ